MLTAAWLIKLTPDLVRAHKYDEATYHIWRFLISLKVALRTVCVVRDLRQSMFFLSELERAESWRDSRDVATQRNIRRTKAFEKIKIYV